MPFGEALFWVGITAVSIGGFILVDKHAGPAWAWILTIGGVLAIAYSVYHKQYPESPNPPELRVLVLLLTWIVFGRFVYKQRRISALPIAEKAEIPKTQLKIHSALYGSGPQNDKNVKPELEQHIVGDSLSLLIGKEILGDPAEGDPNKRLIVEYSHDNGPIRTATRPQSMRLVLPEDPWLLLKVKELQDQAPVHREQPLKMHSAVYGLETVEDIDVSDKLRRAIGNALAIRVDNDLVPRDPAKSQTKRLEVEYSYGTKIIKKISRPEYELMVLPEDSWLEKELFTLRSELQNKSDESTWRLSTTQKRGLLFSLRRLQLETAHEVMFNCHFNALPGGRKLASDLKLIFAEAGWKVRSEINPTSRPLDAFGIWVCKSTPVVRQAVIDALNAIGLPTQAESVFTPEGIILPLDITIGQKID